MTRGQICELETKFKTGSQNHRVLQLYSKRPVLSINKGTTAAEEISIQLYQKYLEYTEYSEQPVLSIRVLAQSRD